MAAAGPILWCFLRVAGGQECSWLGGGMWSSRSCPAHLPGLRISWVAYPAQFSMFDRLIPRKDNVVLVGTLKLIPYVLLLSYPSSFEEQKTCGILQLWDGRQQLFCLGTAVIIHKMWGPDWYSRQLPWKGCGRLVQTVGGIIDQLSETGDWLPAGWLWQLQAPRSLIGCDWTEEVLLFLNFYF